MAKQRTGSAIGLLLFFASMAWVCSVCSGSDRHDPPPRETPPPAVAPQPTPAPALSPSPADPVAAEVAAPKRPHAKHPKPRKRSDHATAPVPDATADELDAALKAALREPDPRPHEPRAVAPSSTCCRHCGPSSQPCGDSCISRSKTCHKGRGCAC